jgi:hypothetical protein
MILDDHILDWVAAPTNQLDYLDGTTIDFLQFFFNMNPVKKENNWVKPSGCWVKR